MPTEESQDLIDLTREICADQLAPKVDAAEEAAEFPRDIFALLGRSGLLSLPYAEELGGGGQPYEVYLQVVEEIASAWMSVAVGVSVHSLTCFPVAEYGSAQQRADLLPDMLSGQTLGAYCLSEPQAGSDVSAISTWATPLGDGSQYAVKGTKAWISHAGHADYYTAFLRTESHPSKGLSCFVVPGDTEGISTLVASELQQPQRVWRRPPWMWPRSTARNVSSSARSSASSRGWLSCSRTWRLP